MSITAKVAPCGTHHTHGGQPLYEERFDWVLPFHEPGLAPVGRGGLAWHIDRLGRPAYPQRFLRSFGFYEGRATVIDDAGWHHILPDGRPLYAERHSWTGNYQDQRCTVRDHEGRYFHLDPQGRSAYRQRYRYAGDFRKGLAVVQQEDGFSLHIDTLGDPLNDTAWQDLDVFHKGFARARDGQGWTHIDKTGHALYPQRYAMVEPFYNGQARVEEASGRRLVIDENGIEALELRATQRSELAELSRDMVGFWRTETISTAVELGIFDSLPGSTAELAARLGLIPSRAQRLLRALAELDLVREQDARWSNTQRGALLCKDHPMTMADAAVEYGRHFPAMWQHLACALRTAGNWQAPDIFRDVAGDPTRVTGHQRMLTSYARHDYGQVPHGLDLAPGSRLIDAGGGLGTVAELIVQHHPTVQAVVLDRPEVIEAARLRVENPDIELRAADLFGPWPTRGDAVLMARVLHDWDDEQALRLLRRARESLGKGGRLFVVEMLLGEEGPCGGLCDLHLLMATGGRERTAMEYRNLFHQAEFDFIELRDLRALPSLLVAVAR